MQKRTIIHSTTTSSLSNGINTNNTTNNNNNNTIAASQSFNNNNNTTTIITITKGLGRSFATTTSSSLSEQSLEQSLEPSSQSSELYNFEEQEPQEVFLSPQDELKIQKYNQQFDEPFEYNNNNQLNNDGLICPITQQLMKEPVLLIESGITYEKEAILNWLKNHDTCPCTNKVLKNKNFIVNFNLKSIIENSISKYIDKIYKIIVKYVNLNDKFGKNLNDKFGKNNFNDKFGNNLKYCKRCLEIIENSLNLLQNYLFHEKILILKELKIKILIFYKFKNENDCLNYLHLELQNLLKNNEFSHLLSFINLLISLFSENLNFTNNFTNFNFTKIVIKLKEWKEIINQKKIKKQQLEQEIRKQQQEQQEPQFIRQQQREEEEEEESTFLSILGKSALVVGTVGVIAVGVFSLIQSLSNRTCNDEDEN
ncbi:hypothetical protein ABK040_014599 [Willaertia magna]